MGLSSYLLIVVADLCAPIVVDDSPRRACKERVKNEDKWLTQNVDFGVESDLWLTQKLGGNRFFYLSQGSSLASIIVMSLFTLEFVSSSSELNFSNLVSAASRSRNVSRLCL